MSDFQYAGVILACCPGAANSQAMDHFPYAERLNQKASPSTVNREKGTLSKMFQVLVELQLVDANPCWLVKNLSQKCEERQVYMAFGDVQRIVESVPTWFKPIVQTAYFTGMRRGEILGLSRGQVNLSARMITLRPGDTKEGRWKRVPLRGDLIPILEDVMKVRTLTNDRVFLLDGQSPHPDSIKHAWRKAVKAVGFTDPRPRFHDLRHTWRANARRSGVDADVAESILGHWSRGRTVNERYGRINDAELLQAVDSMTFDHGLTEIWASKEKTGQKGCAQNVRNGGTQKNIRIRPASSTS